MKKGMLVVVGWVLLSMFLPAMAIAGGDSLRVTAEVFDSYDKTFAYDAAGNYLNRLAHEKGGQLWAEYGGKKVLVDNLFVMKVRAGESISFSVKLDGSHLGDKGLVLDFGKESDWWEVCEWRVNGNVKRTNDTTFNLTLTKGNNVHVGVRLQRKQFAVKVKYHGASGDNYIQDDGSKGPGEPFSSGVPFYVYLRKNGATSPVLQLRNVSDRNLLGIAINGSYRGRYLAKSKLFSDTVNSDVSIETIVAPANSSQRYILTGCIGDGEWERFQVNTLPLEGGEGSDASRYPISGKAAGAVRPQGIEPDDLCQPDDLYYVTAQPKPGSRLVAVLVDGVRMHDTSFRSPENELRFVQGIFAKEGKAVLVLSEVGVGTQLRVRRDGVLLRSGDRVLPGDRLTVDATYRDSVASLRANGVRMAPGDEWIVPDTSDVVVELVAKSRDKLLGNRHRVRFFYDVVGKGSLDVVESGGTSRRFGNGEVLYTKDVKDSTEEKAALHWRQYNFYVAGKPAKGYRYAYLEANYDYYDTIINGDNPYYKWNDTTQLGLLRSIFDTNYTITANRLPFDFRFRAVFAKDAGSPVLVMHTFGQIGYIEVVDVVSGRRLEEGAVLRKGQRLSIQVRGSKSAATKVTKVFVASVNGQNLFNEVKYTTNITLFKAAKDSEGLPFWVGEYKVQDNVDSMLVVGAMFGREKKQPKGLVHVFSADSGMAICQVPDPREGIMDGNSSNGKVLVDGEKLVSIKPTEIERGRYRKGSDYIEVGKGEGGKSTLDSVITSEEDYEVTVVLDTTELKKVEKSGRFPTMRFGQLKKGDDEKPIYVYIRNRNKDFVPITLEQYVDGKKTTDTINTWVGVIYDQVRRVKWKKIGETWTGIVPKGATMEYTAKSDSYQLVSVTINDSILIMGNGAEGLGKVFSEKRVVPEDGNPMKIVALWRKVDQRTLTITTQGDGKVEVQYRGGVDALPHGAIIANDTTHLVVTAEATPGSALRCVRVNDVVIPCSADLENKQVSIPKDKDIHVEAFFTTNVPDQHLLKVKVIGEAESAVEVYNHKGFVFPNSPVGEGEQLIITAKPSVGRRLVQLKVNGMLFQSGALYVVPNGVDVNVEAIFTKVDESSFVLIVDASGNGEVKVERKRKDETAWTEIHYGAPISASTDSILVTAKADPSAKLMKLFVNLAQVRYVDSTGSVVVKSRAGEGDFYVKAIFDEVKADRKPRLHIVALGGGTVNVFTADGTKRLMDGAEIKAGTKIKVNSQAFSGSYAGLLQINGKDWKGDAVYECDGKDVYVVAWFVDSHQTRLLIVIEDTSDVRGMGSVTVSDVREGTTIKNNTLLDQGDMFEVSVDTMLDSAFSKFEVLGPAKLHPVLKGVWTVDGDNEPIIVRVAFLKKWKITFKQDGGDLKDTVQWLDPTDKDPKVHMLPDPKKEGYIFKGWYKTDGSEYHFEKPEEARLTLVAQWVPLYTVTFIAKGITYEIKERRVAEGQLVECPGDPQRPGYIFKGWWYVPDIVQPSDSVLYAFSTPVTKNITLYARFNKLWKVMAYAEPGLPSKDSVMVENDSILNDGVIRNPYRAGFAFKGWRNKATGAPYVFGQPVKEDITLLAIWNEQFRVTFDVNGGTLEVKDTLVEKDSTVKDPGNPTKEGYDFKGWYRRGDTEKYKFTDQVSSNLELVAHYELKRNLNPFLHVFVVDESLKALQGVQVIIKKAQNGEEVFKGPTDGNGVVCKQTDQGIYSIEVVESEGCKGAKAESVELPSNGLDFTFVLQSKRKAEPSGVPSPVESVLLAGVEMYPNPASVVTTLYGLENARRVRVYAVQGVQMMDQEVYGSHELALHVENWVAGVYIVVVEAESGERRVLKLVVRR